MSIGLKQFALATVAAAALAVALPGSAFAQKKFSFAYDQPPTTAYGVAGNLFNEKLMELSGGKMGINQFPGAQLGQEPVMLQKLRSGDIDFVITSTANASTVAPQAGVFSLNFLFRDEDHLAVLWFCCMEQITVRETPGQKICVQRFRLEDQDLRRLMGPKHPAGVHCIDRDPKNPKIFRVYVPGEGTTTPRIVRQCQEHLADALRQRETRSWIGR